MESTTTSPRRSRKRRLELEPLHPLLVEGMNMIHESYLTTMEEFIQDEANSVILSLGLDESHQTATDNDNNVSIIASTRTHTSRRGPRCRKAQRKRTSKYDIKPLHPLLCEYMTLVTGVSQEREEHATTTLKD